MSIIKLFVICFLFYTSLEVSVTKIDVNNFEELVRNTNDIWLLEFYSERCGTCQEFEPTWKKVVPKINGVKIGRINIDKKSKEMFYLSLAFIYNLILKFGYLLYRM